MSVKDNFPITRPQMLIDIAKTKQLDPRVVTTRASSATYYDEFGVLRTALTNEPRVTYDPATGAVQGLVRENQGTNLLTYSEDFSNAVWQKGTVSITSNIVIAPDVMLTSDLLRPTSTNSDSSAYRFYVFSAGVVSISIYAKYAGKSFIAIQGVDAAAGYPRSYFNIQNGTLGAFTGSLTRSIKSVGDGWYRCSISYTASANSVPIKFFVCDANGSTTVTINGDNGIYIWGAQLEANAYPTSYIKTEASQVTRTADSFILTNDNDYNDTEFTAVSQPFGVTSVSANTAVLNGDVPIKSLYVYPRNIAQDQINSVAENDGWWSWRIVGATFALPQFSTDGVVEVDWGDGTVETLTTAVHTFTNASPHIVKFRLVSGTYFKPIMNNIATYPPRVVAVGSAPSNMRIDCQAAFFGCTNLKSFDATLIGITNFNATFYNCTSLTSLPIIDTSAGTNFSAAFINCNKLTSFPLLDTSSGTDFTNTWNGCSQLQSFPLLDTSAGTNFNSTWNGCNSLTSFPLIDTSSGTGFDSTWRSCSSLTSFPLLNINLSTNFFATWLSCTNLQNFPANMFDSWTGVPVANCFLNTWLSCLALTTTSVENILVSINTSGQSAPATGTEITISYNVATGALTSQTTSAITSLKGKNWTIRINGTLQ